MMCINALWVGSGYVRGSINASERSAINWFHFLSVVRFSTKLNSAVTHLALQITSVVIYKCFFSKTDDECRKGNISAEKLL